MKLRGIRQHQLPILGEVEKVEDALFFHQPAGKREVAFLILGDVFARLVGALNARPGNGEVLENLILEDVNHGAVLENAAANLPREFPYLRDDGRVVNSQLRIPPALRKLNHNPGKGSWRRLLRIHAQDPEADLLAN